MTKKEIKKINFKKMEGIVPAVVQHARTKDVLMVGFMNEESVYKTIKDKKVTFWSRSKNRLWRKGETSGNFLNFVNMTLDCDRDTLLVQAIPTGDTCHTGTVTCFGNPKKSLIFLDELYEIISERKKNINSKSYTSSLFVRGVDKIAQKVGEEAVEVVIEAKNKSDQRLIEESSDLIYHLLVLWSYRNIKLSEIIDELKKRNLK